ncbi:class F sortase [Bacillus sp. FJAT-42376]|uniref:class F sortase n=1 Tax=Bacillus sp. FJAT-42376 TaxID=2014076 RepID=UPI000F4D3E9D|nr:class F sortase [Bacillus sp. FJAT-42376]AZB43068.1 class F sortase [Bacillus sp. FJAT-42376]
MAGKNALSSIMVLLFLAGCSGAQEKEDMVAQPVKSIPAETESLKASSSSQAPARKPEEGLTPETLIIPALGIETKVEKAGLLNDGTMDVPKNDQHTAWYKQGARPGEQGNAVIAGHVDNKTGPAVFFNLKKLKTGDEVIILDEKGEKRTFLVEKAESYPYERAPIPAIFGGANEPRLNLITCTGTFDRSKKTHLERLVVYTKLKNS